MHYRAPEIDKHCYRLMFNLSRAERLVIVVLVLSALLGVGINYYKKIYYRVDLRAEPSELVKSNIDIDKLIIEAKLVNINKASPEELTRLPGIGEVLAERIISYRNTKGPFRRIEDITGVKGIGPEKFNKIKEFLIVQ